MSFNQGPSLRTERPDGVRHNEHGMKGGAHL